MIESPASSPLRPKNKADEKKANVNPNGLAIVAPVARPAEYLNEVQIKQLFSTATLAITQSQPIGDISSYFNYLKAVPDIHQRQLFLDFLTYSTTKHREDVVLLLQTLGADLTYIDPNTGLSLVHHWASGISTGNAWSLLQKLLGAGCLLNLPDKEGLYPIHIAVNTATRAAAQNQPAAAENILILLKAGASREVTTKNNLTAEDLAHSSKSDHVIHIFEVYRQELAQAARPAHHDHAHLLEAMSQQQQEALRAMKEQQEREARRAEEERKAKAEEAQRQLDFLARQQEAEIGQRAEEAQRLQELMEATARAQKEALKAQQESLKRQEEVLQQERDLIQKEKDILEEEAARRREDIDSGVESIGALSDEELAYLHKAIEDSNIKLEKIAPLLGRLTVDTLHDKNGDDNLSVAERAAKAHRTDILEALRKKGLDLSHLDHNGESLIHYWAKGDVREGTKESLEFLQDQIGININGKDSLGQTPLHKAAGEGIKGNIICLLKHGANKDLTDNEDQTAMEFAVINDRNVEAAFKVGKPAVVKAAVEAADEDSLKALHEAIKDPYSDLDAIKDLLEAFKDSLELSYGKGKDKMSAIARAAREHRADILDYLTTEMGVKLNKILDKEGNTLVHYWAEGDRETGSLPSLKYLLAKDCKIDKPNKHGKAPLHAAAKNEIKLNVKSLLKNGAKADVKDSNDVIPKDETENESVRKIFDEFAIAPPPAAAQPEPQVAPAAQAQAKPKDVITYSNFSCIVQKANINTKPFTVSYKEPGEEQQKGKFVLIPKTDQGDKENIKPNKALKKGQAEAPKEFDALEKLLPQKWTNFNIGNLPKGLCLITDWPKDPTYSLNIRVNGAQIEKSFTIYNQATYDKLVLGMSLSILSIQLDADKAMDVIIPGAGTIFCVDGKNNEMLWKVDHSTTSTKPTHYNPLYKHVNPIPALDQDGAADILLAGDVPE